MINGTFPLNFLYPQTLEAPKGTSVRDDEMKGDLESQIINLWLASVTPRKMVDITDVFFGFLSNHKSIMYIVDWR